MRNDPHKLVEGCLLACGRDGRARTATSTSAASSYNEAQRLQAAIDEAYGAGLIGKNDCGSAGHFDIYLHHGAGAYICGEETGAAGKPRRQEGPAAAKAAVPGQCRALWLPDHGQQCRDDRGRAGDNAARRRLVRRHRPAEEHAAPRSICISGHVEHAVQCRRGDGHPAHGADRAPWRRRARRLGQSARGDPRRLFGAVCLPKSICDTVLMDFDSLQRSKAALGTAAVIVMDKSTDIVKAIARLSKFYKHESCGQCTPCREGMGWMWRVMERMVEGSAQWREIDMLLEVTTDRGPHDLRAWRCARPGRCRA